MQDLLLLAGFLIFSAVAGLSRIVPPKYRDKIQIAAICCFVVLVFLADILVFSKTITFCPEYKTVHTATLICGNFISVIFTGALVNIFKP